MSTKSDLTYFSIDVETSGLRFHDPESHLLSVGGVAVSHDGWVVDTFYERIRTPGLRSNWYTPDAHPDDTPTCTWWKQQHPFVQNEAWADPFAVRTPLPTVAGRLHSWVTGFGTSWEDRIFVANPASFDFGWVERLLYRGDADNPFHYRTLCLRSMAFGFNLGINSPYTASFTPPPNWHDNHLRAHKPTWPHHPLSDAYAQAQDLISLLGKSDQLDELDEPTYEHAPEEAPR